MWRWQPWSRRANAPVSVSSAVLVFALSGLIALAIVTIGVIYFSMGTARNEAIDDARRLTEVVGRSVVEPTLSNELPTGDNSARAQVDVAVRNRVLSTSIVRVKIWARDGTILYSDDARLIGARFVLGGSEVLAFDGTESDADVSDLSRPENAYDRGWKKLLEVYYPVHLPNGEPVLFETYLPYSIVTTNSVSIWHSFLPALVAGLVILELVQLPLAWSLAYGLKRRQQERESLLQRAVDASERERRLIAGELHDGPVQELVAQSYRLAATADSLRGRAPDDAVQAVAGASVQARQTVRQLRSMLVELYPPSLHSAGLEAALTDLVAPLRAGGVTVEIDVPPNLRLPERTEQLLYRAAREALRNASQHAAPTKVELSLEVAGSRARLLVADNGAGFSAAEQEQRQAGGHVGLALVRSLIQDGGGTVSLTSAPGEGTRFLAEVPL